MIFSYHTMPQWQDQMQKTIAQNPNVTFVAAHPGEKDIYLKKENFFTKERILCAVIFMLVHVYLRKL